MGVWNSVTFLPSFIKLEGPSNSVGEQRDRAPLAILDKFSLGSAVFHYVLTILRMQTVQ